MNRKKLALAVLVLLFAGALVYSYLRWPRQQHVAQLKNRPGAVAPAGSRRGAPAKSATSASVPSTPTPSASAPTASAPTAPAPTAPAPTAPAPAGPAPAVPAQPATAKPAGQSELQVALLEQELPRYAGYRRNLFSPIFRDEVKPPPFKPLPPPPKPVPAPAPVPPPPPPPPPPQPTPEQLAQQALDAELARFVFLGFLKKNGEKTVFLSKNNEIFLAKKGAVLAQKFKIADITDDAITIKAVAGGRELVIPLVENRALRRAQ